MKKHISTSVRPGFAPLIIIGLVTILVFIAAVTFGPWKLDKLGSLTQRQQQQESQAATDQDMDGFADDIEQFMGTDPLDNCPDDTRDNAWPPDVNNDKTVNQADVDAFKPFYNSKAGGSKYNKRYDLNADRKVTLADVTKMGPYFNTTCPDTLLKVTTEGSWANFNWVGSIPTDSRIYISDKNLHGGSCQLPQGVDAGSPTLGSGQTAWVWANDSKIIAGHDYCAAIVGSNVKISNTAEFKIIGYQLTSSVNGAQVNFNWQPGLQYAEFRIYISDKNLHGGSCQLPQGVDAGSPTLGNGGSTYSAISTTSMSTNTGQTSWAWANDSRITAGHNYCAAIFGSTGNFSSNLVEFTLDGYQLSASVDNSQVNFNWQPGINSDGSRVYISDKNLHDGSCQLAQGVDAGSPTLGNGQTSWAWANDSRIIAGHNYCAAIVGSNANPISKVVEFTL